MKTWRIPSALVRRAAFLALLPALLFTLNSGCTSHHQHRTKLAVTTSPDDDPDFRISTLERNNRWLLGYVEIDDQGWLWNPRSATNQMQTVLKAIRDEATNKQGVIIFTFVHGWKHDAGADDDYVGRFRRALNRLVAMEKSYSASSNLTPRKIVGVYVGWRGLTHRTPLIKETTFWDRKRTAHEIGRGAVTELFLRLEAIVNDSKANAAPSRLVIVGHSFGGAITYSALAPIIMERMLASDHSHDTNDPPRGFGDMVALVNPAFEAARFQPLLDAVRRQPSADQTAHWPLNLAVFTSEADNATKRFFPLGRWFATLFQKHQSREEERANHIAIGHYTNFLTHYLAWTPANAPLPDTNAAPAAPAYKQDETGAPVGAKATRKSEGTEDLAASLVTQQYNKPLMKDPKTRADALTRGRFHVGRTTLIPNPNAVGSPFIIAKVSKRLIPDHNGFTTDNFMYFLSEYLLTLAPDERMPGGK